MLGAKKYITNAKRTPLKLAIEKFLDLKRDKAAQTLAQYTLVLNQFREQAGIRFIDEVTSDVLDSYKRHLEKESFAPKAIKNRLLIDCFMLKKNGIQNSTLRDPDGRKKQKEPLVASVRMVPQPRLRSWACPRATRKSSDIGFFWVRRSANVK
jgi:hypothetical protein